MSDIRKQPDGYEGQDRKEAMKHLRGAMREKNECLQDKAHCDNARKAIIDTMRFVMKLDPEYFQYFFKNHQEFAVNFNDYKYVEELCSVVCIVESWATRPGEIQPDPADPYGFIGWIGGLNLHLHASLYFGFTKKELLGLFQLVQSAKEKQIDVLAGLGVDFADIRLQDSEDWMLHYTAAIALRFPEMIKYLEGQRKGMAISDALRNDILGAIKSTYWWKNMMMSRLIESAAEGLPPEISARI